MTFHCEVETEAVARFFDARSNTYETDAASDIHKLMTRRMVDDAGLKLGQVVLDVATGTGLIAIEAARRVGPSGRVVGIDISPGMLRQARSKAEAAGIDNLEWLNVSAEQVSFTDSTFDCVLCSAALVFMPDILKVVHRWYQLTKPGGRVIFDAPAYNSSAAGSAIAEAAKQAGILMAYARLGTVQACRSVMETVGFRVDKIEPRVVDQKLIAMDEAIAAWESTLRHPLSKPLLQLPMDVLAELKEEYQSRMKSLVTENGIPDQTIMNVVFGWKPQIAE